MLEIVTLRRPALKGQAWIIYDNVQSATAAMQTEQGFNFFGKDLKIEYAREASDRIAKRDGTYVPKAKRKQKQQQQAQAQAQQQTQQEQALQEQQGHVNTSTDTTDVTAATSEGAAEEPSHILFAKDLPPECNEMMLAMLFRQYAGFKEVRIPRPGLAFCEFDDEPHATLALERLNGFKLTTSDTLKLAYGKK